MTDLIGMDIDAIRDAVEVLNENDTDVIDIKTIERDETTQGVRWTMTCQADTRTATLSGWGDVVDAGVEPMTDDDDGDDDG